ncbi:MAG: DUF885 domain-containing protein [Firmicutes bacterium]|nr:DUF885 domain-containing protein [Bacillota bacterium]
MAENRKFNDLADRYYKEMDKNSPTSSTYLGIHDYDGLLDDLSSASFERMRESNKEFRQELDSINFDELDNDNKIKWHILDSSIKEGNRFLNVTKRYETDPALYANVAVSVFLLLNREFAPLEDRMTSVASRLEKTPELFQAARENLTNPPRVFTEIAIDILNGSGGLLNDLIPKMAEKVPSIKERMDKALEIARKEISDYREFLETVILPRSNGEYAIGKEMMDEILRENDFLDFTSDDLWEIGKREVEKCEQELTDFCNKNFDPGKTWRENYREVKKHHPREDEVLDVYIKCLEKAKSFVIENDLVDIPENQQLVPQHTPEFFRSLTPLAAYMPPAPFEKDQRAFLWVTPVNPDQPEEDREKQLRDSCYGKISYVSLHECFPGHHLQLVYHSSVQDPVFKRSFSNIFVEGWAFYTEQMMKDHGFFDKESELCQLEAAYWRALRILLDVGIHTGRFTWDEAMAFMAEKTDWSPFIAKGELKRYAHDPSQALSYYTGKLEIFRLKEDYAKIHGKDFPLKKFHQDLLRCGSLPVKLIEWKLGLKPVEKPSVKTAC